jgi:hypothetical protein
MSKMVMEVKERLACLKEKLNNKVEGKCWVEI